MSLDDGPEVMSPSHAAALERGEDPGEPRIDHLASLVGYLRLNGDLSDAFYQRQAKRLVAVASGVREALDHLTAPTPGIRLQQQRRNEVDDETFLLEALHQVEREREHLLAGLRAMRSVHVDRFDPDDVAQDRQDDRDREQRQDERAVEGAPRLAG